MKAKLIPLLVLLSSVGWQASVFAHGVSVDYQTNKSIEIKVADDTGEPIINAQVLVYAPEDLTEPWLTGIADDKGRFTFTPDASKSGNWQVQVRHAGHGEMIKIPVSPEQSTSQEIKANTSDFNPIQKGVMSAVVMWGFVGTALFFSSRKHA